MHELIERQWPYAFETDVSAILNNSVENLSEMFGPPVTKDNTISWTIQGTCGGIIKIWKDDFISRKDFTAFTEEIKWNLGWKCELGLILSLTMFGSSFTLLAK